MSFLSSYLLSFCTRTDPVYGPAFHGLWPALVLTLALAGCGSPPPAQPKSSPPVSKQAEPPAKPEVKVEPPKAAVDPTPKKQLAKPAARLSFEKLPLDLKLHDGKTVAFAGHRLQAHGAFYSLDRLTRWPGVCDVLWNRGHLFLWRGNETPQAIDLGLTKPGPTSLSPYFTDVVWDGERLWVATTKDGIAVVTPDGKVDVRFHDGVPFWKHTVLLHPISPGRVCAVGSSEVSPASGKVQTWCVLLEVVDKTPKLTVFHKAAELPGQGVAETLGFEPVWMRELKTGAAPRHLLVGRNRQNRPLRIDLETLKVDLGDKGFTDYGPPHSFYSSPKGWIEVERGLIRVCPPGKKPEIRPLPGWGLKPLGEGPDYAGVLLEHEGMLYVPGTHWRRIDPKTYEDEPLAPEPVAPEHVFRYYAVSEHGIVGWTEDGAMHRIRITEAPSP